MTNRRVWGQQQALMRQPSRSVPALRRAESLDRRIEDAGRDGLVGAARVQAAAYVTHVALTQVAILSAEEERLITQCPLAEPRMKVILDLYAGFCAGELAQLGW